MYEKIFVCLCLIKTFMWLYLTNHLVIFDKSFIWLCPIKNFVIPDKHICLVMTDKTVCLYVWLCLIKQFVYMSGYD